MFDLELPSFIPEVDISVCNEEDREEEGRDEMVKSRGYRSCEVKRGSLYMLSSFCFSLVSLIILVTVETK